MAAEMSQRIAQLIHEENIIITGHKLHLFFVTPYGPVSSWRPFVKCSNKLKGSV